MSSDLPTYGMGATSIAVGLSATVRVLPPSGCNGGFFKIAVGSGGTLALVNGISSTVAGLSGPLTAGYILGGGEAISMSGPAAFYLAAAGATAMVSCVFTYSQGYIGT